MPVDIEELVISAEIGDDSSPLLDEETLERLKVEILATCAEEMAKALARLRER